MDSQSPISIRTFIRVAVAGCLIAAGIGVLWVFRQDTVITFCDVSQGDAAHIRIDNHFDILIDAGPDESVLRCLGRTMPFYDHTIELAILTHPQQDHLYGFLPVLDHYGVDAFAMNPVDNDSDTYRRLVGRLTSLHVPVQTPTAGTTIAAGRDTIRFYWPSKSFLDETISESRISTRDLNEYSYVLRLTEGRFSALFTGDSPPEILDGLPERDIGPTDIIKIPHHSSVNGLTPRFLRLADPRISVISVGYRNRFHHPSPEIIQMLHNQKKMFMRTDEKGTISIRIPYNAAATDVKTIPLSVTTDR